MKIRGFRIELGEIEAALCQHPAIHEAVVVAREDMPGVKRLVAYLVTSLSERDAETICEHLKASLPEFMVPAAFMFLDRLPLSPNGKIDRKALPIPAKAQDLTNSYVAPRTVIEQKLAEIWSRVLRVKHVGVHDNFFELGGDSILSIQAIASARREGLMITPMVLFANPTIAQLASVASIAENESAIEDIAAGDVLLTPIQRWFLEQDLESPHHFNQAFCFEVIGRLDQDLVQSVLKELSQHHDALRLRYSGGSRIGVSIMRLPMNRRCSAGLIFRMWKVIDANRKSSQLPLQRRPVSILNMDQSGEWYIFRQEQGKPITC